MWSAIDGHCHCDGALRRRTCVASSASMSDHDHDVLHSLGLCLYLFLVPSPHCRWFQLHFRSSCAIGAVCRGFPRSVRPSSFRAHRSWARMRMLRSIWTQDAWAPALPIAWKGVCSVTSHPPSAWVSPSVPAARQWMPHSNWAWAAPALLPEAVAADAECPRTRGAGTAGQRHANAKGAAGDPVPDRVPAWGLSALASWRCAGAPTAAVATGSCGWLPAEAWPARPRPNWRTSH